MSRRAPSPPPVTNVQKPAPPPAPPPRRTELADQIDSIVKAVAGAGITAAEAVARFSRDTATGVDLDLVDDEGYTLVHRAADRRARAVRNEFVSAVQRLAADLTEDRLEYAIRQGGSSEPDTVEAVMELIDDLAVRFRPVTDALTEVFDDAGERAADALRDQLRVTRFRAAQPATPLRFDATNPRAVDTARHLTAELIREVQESFRQQVRLQVERAFLEGRAPRQLARDIRDQGLGLTSRQTQTVQRFRERLVGEGVTGDALERRVSRFYDATLRRRATTIARTETLRASNEGQQELWRQAREANLVGQTSKREWVATPDDRLHPGCEAVDGVQVGMEESFETEVGPLMAPPMHPGCRCTTSLAPEEPD